MDTQNICIWAHCDVCEAPIESTQSTFYAFSIPHCSNYCRLQNMSKIKYFDQLYYPKKR